MGSDIDHGVMEYRLEIDQSGYRSGGVTRWTFTAILGLLRSYQEIPPKMNSFLRRDGLKGLLVARSLLD